MTKLQDIDTDKQVAKLAAQLYITSMTAITTNWPNLGALPANAQTALNALRNNQERILRILKYVYQNQGGGL